MSGYQVTVLGPASIVYLDANARVGLDSDRALLANVEAINGQLFNLFTCPVGDEPWEPELGGTFPNLIFDPMDPGTEHDLQFQGYIAINRWLGSRLSININSIVVQRDIVSRTYVVIFTYVLIGLALQVTYGLRLQPPGG